MSSMLNVLLVEDNEEDYIITRDLFSKAPGPQVELEWVTSYDGALERITRKCHDVYVFDYYLGEHTGVELLEWALQYGIDAPVIILTGQGEREIDLEAMNAGATHFLVKGRTDAASLERAIRYASEHARRLVRLRDLTIRDELTGLYNRREMNRLLESEVARCRRYGGSLSLIMIDIDNFKTINDTFGHLEGDKVLRTVAQMLSKTLRSTDSIARYGGDELAIILPETSGSGALVLAEHLRIAVMKHDFGNLQPSVHSTGMLSSLSPTISLGVAWSVGGSHTAESLLMAADQALYKAKKSGQNRTVCQSHRGLITTPLMTNKE